MVDHLLKTLLLLVAGGLVSGCAHIKEAGRTIGHTTRDVTREIGHGTRDVVKESAREPRMRRILSLTGSRCRPSRTVFDRKFHYH